MMIKKKNHPWNSKKYSKARDLIFKGKSSFRLAGISVVNSFNFR